MAIGLEGPHSSVTCCYSVDALLIEVDRLSTKQCNLCFGPFLSLTLFDWFFLILTWLCHRGHLHNPTFCACRTSRPMSSNACLCSVSAHPCSHIALTYILPTTHVFVLGACQECVHLQPNFRPHRKTIIYTFTAQMSTLGLMGSSWGWCSSLMWRQPR